MTKRKASEQYNLCMQPQTSAFNVEYEQALQQALSMSDNNPDLAAACGMQSPRISSMIDAVANAVSQLSLQITVSVGNDGNFQ